MTMDAFVELFDCRSPDAARLGGKGASLCRLVEFGYRVPPGFILTVDAFEHTCDALGLSASLARVEASLSSADGPSSAGDEILAGLESGRIPSVISDAVRRALDELRLWQDNPAGLIVRSSATVEDSASHSFAGIFESIPITAPEELDSAICHVWASVFSPRALAYFREVGLTSPPTMAVVVQRFVAAERSGVMFTSFRGRTLIEHVEGDCEKLVKGEVTPEQLWLAGPNREPASEGSLAAPHVRELARLSRTLEADFGGPQDVEWVLYDERIHVVQSRPITVPFQDGAAPAVELADVDGATPILRGTGASGGWGIGAVHLAFNIDDAMAVVSGQVLVTPMTNPDMVVAMRRAVAIVTDVGGMICHAAIVSRELGLPCVVGTATATTTLRNGDVVTVGGANGVVYRGALNLAARAPRGRPAEWSDIWAGWTAASGTRTDLVPLVSTIEALEAIPPDIAMVVLVPDMDVRAGPAGLWVDVERLPGPASDHLFESYLNRLDAVASRKRIGRVYVLPRDGGLFERVSTLLLSRPDGALRMHRPDFPPGLVAVPLAALGSSGSAPNTGPLAGMDEAKAAALDTIKFFGHAPASHESEMPRPEWRNGWWALLPEYERYHLEHATASAHGTFTWLEIRPELVISPMLKSLVQPGFEMVPRVMGFWHLAPMHIKWRRCRYHFRSDTFALVWRAIVTATWSDAYMSDLMRRVRASYTHLSDLGVLFPRNDAERAALSPLQIETLITTWWPRWTEFFALCWFIQAQGDDVLYPFIEETVKDNLRRAHALAPDVEWPVAQDLVAPLSPVLSGAYMSDVTALRDALLAADLRTVPAALEALARGDHPDLARLLDEHLAKWHWMRDRDLVFEPWDTPTRVIETALRTDAHSTAPYAENRRRHMIALAVHYDLAHASGRAEGLHHAVRFLHDLNVERENHHVLWLKFSYPVRALILEVQRRLLPKGGLREGDIFFLEAPELIAATRALPDALSPDLVELARERRKAYVHEARLGGADPSEPRREDDYY